MTWLHYRITSFWYHVRAGRLMMLASGLCGRPFGHVTVDGRARVRLYCGKPRGHEGKHWLGPDATAWAANRGTFVRREDGQ